MAKGEWMNKEAVHFGGDLEKKREAIVVSRNEKDVVRAVWGHL